MHLFTEIVIVVGVILIVLDINDISSTLRKIANKLYKN